MEWSPGIVNVAVRVADGFSPAWPHPSIIGRESSSQVKAAFRVNQGRAPDMGLCNFELRGCFQDVEACISDVESDTWDVEVALFYGEGRIPDVAGW